MEPKIKQSPTIPIGENIRRIRLEKGMGQTELVRQIQLRAAHQRISGEDRAGHSAHLRCPASYHSRYTSNHL